MEWEPSKLQEIGKSALHSNKWQKSPNIDHPLFERGKKLLDKPYRRKNLLDKLYGISDTH
jgi:hypothetical protein